MNNASIKAAGIAGLALCSVSAWAAQPLFTKDLVSQAMSNSARSQVIQNYRNEYQNVRLEDSYRLNHSAWAARSFDVTLPHGEVVTIRANKRYQTATAEVVLGNDTAKNSVSNIRGMQSLQETVLVNNNGLITGSIRHQGKLFSIRSLENGEHVIMEVDETRMPEDHPQHDYTAIFEEALNAQVQAAPVAEIGMAANTVINLLVNYTPAAKNAVSNINGLIDLAVAETNAGYSNSGVGITVQVAYRAQTSYTESSSMSTDRDRYASKTDSYMNEIHTQRDTYKADVAVLILNNSSSCGIAKAIGATSTTAFAVVHHSCATGYYSFAHEIGHLQSARHDPSTDPTTTPYVYGHGYRAPNNKWRTVMAYNCSPSCPRINYWSNPLKTYSDGQKMGTTTKSDNTRVLNNTKATIAGFR